MVIDTGMENHVDLPNRPTSNCGGVFGGCSDGPVFHGTHVSGILMARDNSIGVVGVAPGLANNDVYSWGACNPVPGGGCDASAIAAGITAAINNGIDIINMSLGGPNSPSIIADAVSSAWSSGIVMVASAGNHPHPTMNPGDVVYPANYWQVVGVSGVRDNGFFADTSPCTSGGVTAFSNHGPHVDISAPFWALSTVGTSSYEDETNGWCGTSMAAPYVSGAAALLRAQNPSWSNQQIIDKLVCTANHPIGAFSHDEYYGHGVLDVQAALTSSSGSAFAMISWLNPVAESGHINISFKGHTTSIPVTSSSSLANAIISGINGDGSANLTATGGGSNRILFLSKTPGSNDNGQWVHIGFNPTWLNPVAESGHINISFKAHPTSSPVTSSSSLANAIISGINGDGSANLTATGGGSNRILFLSKTPGSNDNGQWVHIGFNPTWMDPGGNVFDATSMQVSCGHN